VVSLAWIHKYTKYSPLQFTELPSNPQSPAAFCEISCLVAIRARKIVGPVFFNETIKEGRCVEVILGQFFPELTEE
jgi:hypothetical protein